MKVPHPYYIERVHQLHDGTGETGAALGRYDVYVLYDPPLTAVPTTVPNGLAARGSGGSLLRVEAVGPTENVDDPAYGRLKFEFNGPPVIDASYCTAHTTFDYV